MARKLLFVASAAMVIFFASCKKDLVKEGESINGDVQSSNAAVDSKPETSPPVYTSVVTNVNSNCAGFWQAVPSLYNQTTKKYPLIIFLHGIGELGTSLNKMNCCGLPNYLNNKTFPAEFVVNNQRHSFIVMAPQFKVRATAAHVQSVIDYAKARFRVDDTRIYVTGLSLGGGSTWDYSAAYGESAAAIVPVCGGTKPNVAMAQNIAKKNLPIWAMYSTADQFVPAQWGRDFFAWIDQYNTAFATRTKLTIWTDVDHNNTWGRAFNPKTRVDGYNMYEWMLLFKKGVTSAPGQIPNTGKAPSAVAGADQSIPMSWKFFPELNGNFSKATVAGGWIAKYVWTKISGPAATITPTGSGRSKVTGYSAGTYVFRLTVTDNKGVTAIDDIKITLTGGAAPGTGNLPFAMAGNNQSIPRSWKFFPELNGNFSKATIARGWITKYVWTKISGPAATLTPIGSGRAKVTGFIPGIYIFRLTVTDNKGSVSTDDLQIVITNN